MPSCLEEMVSALYIGLTGRYRLTYEDRAMQAEDDLVRLMVQLDRRTESLEAASQRLRQEALALRRDRARCRPKVAEYRRTRAQLVRLQTYRDMVMQHMDALRNTELNKSLIITLQESSRTLKALGVVEGVQQAELVVQDVEASMQHVRDLTKVLGKPICNVMELSTDTEEDLERELEALLHEEERADEDEAEVAKGKGPGTGWRPQLAGERGKEGGGGGERG